MANDHSSDHGDRSTRTRRPFHLHQTQSRTVFAESDSGLLVQQQFCRCRVWLNLRLRLRPAVPSAVPTVCRIQCSCTEYSRRRAARAADGGRRCHVASRPVIGALSRSVGRSVCSSVGMSVGRSVPVGRSVGRSVGLSVGRPICWYVGLCISAEHADGCRAVSIAVSQTHTLTAEPSRSSQGKHLGSH